MPTMNPGGGMYSLPHISSVRLPKKSGTGKGEERSCEHYTRFHLVSEGRLEHTWDFFFSFILCYLRIENAH